MKKNLLCVAGAIIIVVIFIGLRKNSAPLVSTKTYQCIQMHDTILSDEYFSAINNTVENLCKEHCAAHIIIDRLKKDFLALNKVVIAYQPSGTRVMISAHEPQCCLNNSVILTTHKELLPKNVFTEDAIADIPNIMCHLPLDISSRARPEPVEGYLGALENPSTNSGRAHREQMGNNVNIAVLVSSLLQKLPSDIYQTYNLELIHEHCLHFSYKQQPQFTILSSVAQSSFAPSFAESLHPTHKASEHTVGEHGKASSCAEATKDRSEDKNKLPQLLSQCEVIKQTIDEKKGFDKGTRWVADTRFAHYIVAYKA